MVSLLPSLNGSAVRDKLGEQVVEALVALAHTAGHARIAHRVAGLDRLEHRVGADRGLAVLLLERNRVHRDVAGRTLELEGLHDGVPRWRPVEDAVEPPRVARVVGVDVPPGAAVTEVV